MFKFYKQINLQRLVVMPHRFYYKTQIITPKQVELDVIQMVGNGSAIDIQRGDCIIRLPEIASDLINFIHYSHKVVSKKEK